MTGLLEKDFRLIFKRKQSLVMFLMIALIMGFSMDGTFLVGYMTFLCTVFTISTISYDELDTGYPFLMTLPIDGKIYVYEKYLFCFISGIAAWSFGMILLVIMEYVKGVSANLTEDLLGGIAMIPLFMLIAAIMIPLELKYGAEKSRIALAFIYGACVVVVVAIKRFIDYTGIDIIEKFSSWNQLPTVALYAIGYLVAIIIFVVSLMLSVKIMNHKEW